MCGIVGYVGKDKAKEKIIDGLKRLEYRGYDSAGIALAVDGKIQVKKHVGGIENLEKIIGDAAFESNTGIGHTRWATHGAPSDANAHPHVNEDNTIAIVHNGIIENYVELRQWLSEEKGVTFKSETDSETIAHLIGVFYKGDLLEAVNEAVKKMRGAYAICVISSEEPDKIIAVRKDAPLVVGKGEGFNFIASDIPALLTYTKQVYLLENNETVVLTSDDAKIFDENGSVVKRDVLHVTWDVDAAEKEGYEHFMLKEIHEQPKGISETLMQRLDENDDIRLDGISLTREDIEKFQKIYIVACGTAYHAGLVGKYIIEKFARVPVEVDVASEFRYRDPIVDKNTLFIAISQSGETTDTLEALREARRKGARILSIVNVVGSSVARESDDVFYTWAGPEIAVASTKAYTTQLICMYLIALYIGRLKGSIAKDEYKAIVDELKEVPDMLRQLLKKEPEIQKIAERFYRREKIFFIGRGMDTTIAYEGSLKLKEISYINSFAIAAGELKHGTIALVEPGVLFVAMCTQDKLCEKMVSNVQEIIARNGEIIAVAKEGDEEIRKHADYTFYIPECSDDVAPIMAIVPLQLFAYYVSVLRGNNVDKPRNLAKSVTVE